MSIENKSLNESLKEHASAVEELAETEKQFERLYNNDNPQETASENFESNADKTYTELLKDLEETPLGELSQTTENSVNEFVKKSLGFLDTEAPKESAYLYLTQNEKERFYNIFSKAKKLEAHLNEMKSQRSRKELSEKGEIMESEVAMTQKDKKKQIISGIKDIFANISVVPLMAISGAYEYKGGSFMDGIRKIRESFKNSTYDKYKYLNQGIEKTF